MYLREQLRRLVAFAYDKRNAVGIGGAFHREVIIQFKGFGNEGCPAVEGDQVMVEECPQEVYLAGHPVGVALAVHHFPGEGNLLKLAEEDVAVADRGEHAAPGEVPLVAPGGQLVLRELAVVELK